MSHRPAPMLLLRTRVGAYVAPAATDRYQRWEIYDHLDGLPRRHIARERVHWQSDGGHTETLQMSLGGWLRLCREGIPDALDVMFASVETTEVDILGELRAGWRADDLVLKRYRRHARAAACASSTGPRARRLAHNLDQLSQWGRYEPTAWARAHHAEQYSIAA